MTFDLPDDPDATAPRAWPPILVLGRDTCEDTTMSRAHLAERGIPFDYRQVDVDPDADAWIRRLNDGNWVTPTILIGEPAAPTTILREPANDELDAAIDRSRA
jgi:glutaredoxin